jgi:ADP-ribosylglycohydrolase
VVQALEAALCGPSTTPNPSKRVALKAVNLGDDTYTTGAI